MMLCVLAAGWPVLLGLTGIPSLLQLLTLPFFPESPRYLLIQKGNEEQARKGTAPPCQGRGGEVGWAGPARGTRLAARGCDIVPAVLLLGGIPGAPLLSLPVCIPTAAAGSHLALPWPEAANSL